jgi:hypothetical protein
MCAANKPFCKMIVSIMNNSGTLKMINLIIGYNCQQAMLISIIEKKDA